MVQLKISDRNVAPIVAAFIFALLTSSCGTNKAPAQPRRQITSCPEGMLLICTTNKQEPSKGGDDEIPQYERCVCQLAN